MSEPADGAEDRSPFQGLGFYTESDAKWFFGRATERKIILAHLRTTRLTRLYAETGVGKSSLLRAGVAARFRELAAAIDQAASTLDATLVIILDQFEEQFRYRLSETQPLRPS